MANFYFEPHRERKAAGDVTFISAEIVRWINPLEYIIPRRNPVAQLISL
ncbi:hypothetical protein [Kamptonema formosum]|nr:hypothetical protein [Oscillatoria sp. PCC 10802]